MLRLAEMADYKYMKSLSRAVGQKQHGQAGHSQKNDKGLKLENLTSAKALRHLRQNADDKEVRADDQDRQGRPKDRQRGIHVDLGQSRSRVGHRQEEDTQSEAQQTRPSRDQWRARRKESPGFECKGVRRR